MEISPDAEMEISEGEAPTRMNVEDNTLEHQNQTPITNERRTRSGRIRRMPKRYDDYEVYETSMEEKLEAHTEYTTHVVYGASNDPDTLYYHQILKEEDKVKFFEAMEKEINYHNKKHHWRPIRRNKIPKGR
jgi:hypothetical protein